MSAPRRQTVAVDVDGDDAEKAVLASLEGQLEGQRRSKLERVAHLPFLLRKMKSRANLSAEEWKNINRHACTDSRAMRPSSSLELLASQTSTRGSNSSNSSKNKMKDQLHQKPIEQTTTDKDAFFDNAMHLETLMEETKAGDDDDFSLSSTESNEDDMDSPNEETTLLETTKEKRLKKRSKGFYARIKAQYRRWKILLRPEDIRDDLVQFLKVDVLLGMLPLLIAAFILFYVLGNPDLEFLPNTATLAWYLIFVVRLQVTFALARCTQFVLELIAIRTSWLAQWSGPFLALIAMQSLGWPFLLTAWGCWNLVLLHGHHAFCKHWLDASGIAIFTVEHNPDGDGILSSDLYGRILFAMVFVGTATAMKRTTVALFLSRRMLRNYKEQLENIMENVKLIVGVAELAAETDKPGFAEILADAEEEQSVRSVASQVQMESKSNYMDSVPTFSTPPVVKENDVLPDFIGGDEQDEDGKWQELKEQVIAEDTHQTPTVVLPETMPVDSKATGANTNKPNDRSKSTFDRVFASLDQYEPPPDRSIKEESPSLHDILQFRKAKMFVDTGYPFTTIFGQADTRKHCIESAIQVFQKLQRFEPGNTAEDALTFDVIGALAYTEEGMLDEFRAHGLLRLFSPSSDNKVTLKEFVQSCDNVYKQIIFLGASMRNASKIDKVLEEMFSAGFYGVLAVMILSLVGLNPWPLLVSFGTMLLSLAFALGPSCAKTIEGILAIAVRRPFDLGDRISLVSGLATSTPGLGNTWIVEDINLTTTTLRYASTNEVSTINNSSLSEARIVNCARSSKAIIRFRVAFRSNATQHQLHKFRQMLDQYIQNHPQVWAGLVQFANDGIQSDDGFVVYMIGVQHVKSWQELGKIVTNKGELTREADRIAHELDIHYESPTGKMNVEMVQKKTDVC